MLWCFRVFVRSFVMREIQVTGGLPTGRLWGVIKRFRAFWAGVSGCKRRIWPSRDRRLFLIFLAEGNFFCQIVKFFIADGFGVYEVKGYAKQFSMKGIKGIFKGVVRDHVSEFNVKFCIV